MYKNSPAYCPTVFVELRRVFTAFLIIARYYFINNSFIENISGVFTIYCVNKFLYFYIFNINKYKELGYYEIFFNINNGPYLVYIYLVIIYTPIR